MCRAMVQGVEQYIAYEEYLETEVKGTVKHERLDGVVYATGGGSKRAGRERLA